MKKLRPSDDSSKKAKIHMVKVGGEDLYHVGEELSQLQKKLVKKNGMMKKQVTQTEKR